MSETNDTNRETGTADPGTTDAGTADVGASDAGAPDEGTTEGGGVERGEIVAARGAESESGEQGDAVTSPAKVMRIGSMVKALLEEVRAAPLDEPSRERLAEIYERSVVELSGALSPDLQEELRTLALPFHEGPDGREHIPSEGEIRVAKAQLVGWLEGLFHGIQATLFAQQLAARQQLEQMRQLPGAPPMPGGPGQEGMPQPPDDRAGTYL